MNVVAAPADLDPTFGNGGKVVSSPDDSGNYLSKGMAIQSDGKIVRVGYTQPASTNSIVVARYNADGSLDTTFGNNGWTSVSFGGDKETADEIVIQADGKIVIGGVTEFPNFNNEVGIARFNSDGSLDTTFADNGIKVIGFTDDNGTFLDFLGTLEMGANGKIVIAGKAFRTTSFQRHFISRLNADGSFDTNFGTDGKMLEAGQDLHDLVIQPDGTLFAVGYNSTSQFSHTLRVIKYNSDGSRGWEYTEGSMFGATPNFRAIALQSDGKLVVAGTKEGMFYVIRLTPTGSLDNTFTPPTTPPGSEALSLAIQADGKIVVVGKDNFPNDHVFFVVRYNADGSLDSGFGNGGIVNTDISNNEDQSTSVLIQPDGKILVGGFAGPGGGTGYRFIMARYLGGNLIPDNPAFDYDGDGKSDISVFRSSNSVWYLNQSTNGFTTVQFGISTDRIVPADFDGDGKTDIAIYRDGVWWILQSETNTVIAIQFGAAEDKPQTGDFDQDGKDDIAVFRPSEGAWYILGIQTADFPQLHSVRAKTFRKREIMMAME